MGELLLHQIILLQSEEKMILRDKNKTQETGNKKAREQDQAFSVTKMSHFGALFLPQVSSDKGLAENEK